MTGVLGVATSFTGAFLEGVVELARSGDFGWTGAGSTIDDF
jgi:hypothetical protein